MAVSLEELKTRQAEGYALTQEAQQRIREHETAELEAKREQAKAKRITENLALEPQLRAELEEAQSDVRGLIHSLVQAIPRVRELRDQHEAVARMLRADGESCVQVPTMKVQGIQDRGLYHDLDGLRQYVMWDF
jgi:hypothetical protein